MKILKLLRHSAVRPATNRLLDSALLLIAMPGGIGYYLYCSTAQFVVTIQKISRDRVAFDVTQAFAL